MAVKVLIVEDEAPIRTFERINLEKAGYECLEAASGEEGLELARSQHPDIVILDLMLPGMDGFEVCETLRTEMPQLGIIMLTAKSQEVDKILGLEKGTDDYMVKPFNPHELVLRVKSLARRLHLEDQLIERGRTGGEEPPKRMEDGPFALDLYSHVFYKNGQEVDLTPTEISIVKLFLSNPGRAFSRDQILDEIWGEDYQGDSKIVDVNIRRIRAKVEDKPAKPEYLQTVWGVGYRWKKSK